MTGEDHERRLATNEANIENFAKSQARIEDYMKALFEQNGEIKTSVALLVKSQEGMTKYQEGCDRERRDLDKRVTETEGYQKRQMRSAGGIAAAISIVFTGAIELFRR